jgi:hypothetical protein
VHVRLLEVLERAASRGERPLRCLGVRGNLCQVHDDPFWVRLVSDPRLLSIAARYIGEDIALFASHYIAKPPGDGQPVLFHQDGSCKLLCLLASCVLVPDLSLKLCCCCLVKTGR